MTTASVPAPRTRVLVGARLVSLLAALFWGVLFFGLIDLQVVLAQNEVFYLHYVLESGWGLLYTLLVMVPLLVWSVRPSLVVLPRCVLVVGAAVLLTGLAFGSLGQAAAGAALVASAAPGTWLSREQVPLQSLRSTPLLAGVLALGVVGAIGYLGVLVADLRSGRSDEETWGLMHLPMQAALTVAVPACVAMALLLRPAPGWRLGLLLPAAASGVLGIVCVAYPLHLGSAGTAGGTAMILWAVLLAGLSLMPGPSGIDEGRYGPDRGSTSGDRDRWQSRHRCCDGAPAGGRGLERARDLPLG